MIMKGKRANITLEGHDIIMTKALEYPRLKRTSVAEKIQAELKSKGYDTPEIEVLERKISWWRNHDEDDPQDKPLSMVILAQPQPPIPLEAMPAVLRVWNWRVSCDEPFSIREAKWVSRLYTIFDPVNDQQTLMDWASGLAHREILCNMSKIPFTTHDLDTLLTEADNSKIIQDTKMGRLKIYRSKPTIRDILEKAKRTPSAWPAGVKTKTPWDAVIQELVAKGEVSEDVLYDSDAIIRWFKSLDPTKQKEIRRRAEELSPGAFAESPEEKVRLEALSEAKRKQVLKKRKQEKGGTT